MECQPSEITDKTGKTYIIQKYCRHADGSYSDKHMYVKQLTENCK